MTEKQPRVVIVGAGVAGLVAARTIHSSAPNLFDVVILEGNDRIGGRILTSDFSGERIELGATWIHGVDGSPIHALASDAGALRSDGLEPSSWERMDGFPSDPIVVTEDGNIVAKEVADEMEELFERLKDAARDGEVAVACDGDLRSSVGAYLRAGLEEHRSKKHGGAGDVQARELEEMVFRVYMNWERTHTSVDDLDDLDLAAEREYADFPGKHVTIPGGYSMVVEHLASLLPAGWLQLRRRVRRVEWGYLPVRLHLDDGGVLAADHVIITVSLGVLKAGLGGDCDAGITFDPPLPASKRSAVDRLGFGAVDKLFVEMSSSPSFRLPFLQMAFDGRTAPAKEIPWWMRRTPSLGPIHGDSRVALAWLAGKEAKHLEKLPDGEIIAGVEATLAAFLLAGEQPRVVSVRQSAWAADPLFLGSYSYVAVGASGDDLDAMAEPLLVREDGGGGGTALQVMFAGEATDRAHYSTTHGAYLSGRREAERLLRHYRCADGVAPPQIN